MLMESFERWSMRKAAPQALTTEQRWLQRGPWWAAGALGVVVGAACAAGAWIHHPGSAGLWILGAIFLISGWAIAGMVRQYRTRHMGGLEGRNAPAQLWLLGKARLARMVAASYQAEGWKPLPDPQGRRTDHLLEQKGKRWRLRVMRQPGAASLWTVDSHWLEVGRDRLDGLILVNLGYFSVAAEDYARERNIVLLHGPDLLARVCTHPDWLAMAEAKARWRTQDGAHESPETTLARDEAHQDVRSLALVGLEMGTRLPRGKDDLDHLERLAGGLGWTDLEVGVRTLQLALTQACHDPGRVAHAWVRLIVEQRPELAYLALWDVEWLVEWLEEDPNDAVWDALGGTWSTLAEHLPHTRDTHTRAEQEAPLMVLWKLWNKTDLHSVSTRARMKVQEKAEHLGTLRVYAVANVLLDDIEQLNRRRGSTTARAS